MLKSPKKAIPSTGWWSVADQQYHRCHGQVMGYGIYGHPSMGNPNIMATVYKSNNDMGMGQYL